MDGELRMLKLQVDILNVQLNARGSYVLRLTLLSSMTPNGEGVWVRRAPGERVVASNNAWIELDAVLGCSLSPDAQITFYFPDACSKCCRGDNEVFLSIEVQDETQVLSAGQCTFTVLPRAEEPDWEGGQPAYSIVKVLTLIQSREVRPARLHCGKLELRATLTHKDDSTVLQPAIVVPKTPYEGGCQPDAVCSRAPATTGYPAGLQNPHRARPLHLCKLPSETKLPERPKKFIQPTFLTEFGPGSVDPNHSKGPKGFLVATVHAASNLPLREDGRVPTPYCLIQITDEESDEIIDEKSGTPTIHPTTMALWEESFMMQAANDNDISQLEVNMVVMDCESQEVLASCSFPVSFLQPFYTYHLHLTMPLDHKPSPVSLFVTLMRTVSVIRSQPEGPEPEALQVTLIGFDQPLLDTFGPFVVSLRMADDYTSVAQGEETENGVQLRKIAFPDPNPSVFSVDDSELSSPQVTSPGHPADQPRWMQSFLFMYPKDVAVMRNQSSSIVAEFYKASSVLTEGRWCLQHPVGVCHVPLGEAILSQLSSPEGSAGLLASARPVQGETLKCTGLKTPTVSFVLRLLNFKKSQAPPCRADPFHLPVLDLPSPNNESDLMHGYDIIRCPSEVLTFKGRHVTDEEDTNPLQDGLPGYDALEGILPDYKYIFVDPEASPFPAEPPARPLPRTTPSSPAVEDDGKVQRTRDALLDYQAGEMEKFRRAVQTMGQDILSLRERIRQTEAENSRLRIELAHYNDATRLLTDSTDLDGLSKPELAMRYVALKKNLNSVAAELGAYKERVTELQRNLIEKNEREKEHVRMSWAHQSQQEVMQRLQAKVQKVKRLEEACKKQEGVIQRMEKLLESSAKNKTSSDSAAKDALMQENRRLRGEMDGMRERLGLRSREEEREEMERLELFEKLDRSDSRIASLESQLAENARRWAREKSDLQARLWDAEMGMAKKGSFYRDYPKIPPREEQPLPRQPPRKFSKAPSVATRRSKPHHCDPLESSYTRR